MQASQLGELGLQTGNLPPPFCQHSVLPRNHRRLRRDQCTCLFRQSGDIQCHDLIVAEAFASDLMTVT